MTVNKHIFCVNIIIFILQQSQIKIFMPKWSKLFIVTPEEC